MPELAGSDFPAIARENRVYTARDRHIATAPSAEMAQEIADRLNHSNDFVVIPRLDLGPR